MVSAEILSASELGCPIEMHRIAIEKCDEMYDPDCKGDAFMPFHRAHYDKNTGQSPNSPREQVRHDFFRQIGIFFTHSVPETGVKFIGPLTLLSRQKKMKLSLLKSSVPLSTY